MQFVSATQVLLYLPRAAAIGFFAPFPDMWFTPGTSVGSSGRLLVGAESSMMYFIESLAVYGLWQSRRRFSAWLLFLASAVGMIALGFVVSNVGALYRMRYLFLIMMIPLAMNAAASALRRIKQKLPQRIDNLDAAAVSSA